MSDQDSKEKRSKRILKEECAIRKQIKIAKQKGIPVNKEEIHRFAKHKAMDCGNPECAMCGNPRKIHKDKLTKQEKSFYQEKVWQDM